MSEDLLRVLGHLALGSRLKRIGEQLQQQAQPVLESTGTRLSAAQYPLLIALDRAGPLGAVELAAMLGIRQPGVTRVIEKLKAAGLVAAKRVRADRRQRPVALTRAGRALIARSRLHAWPQLEAAVVEACGAGSSLLKQLAALEDALATAPLATRVARLQGETRSHAAA